jgi:hypothetical protein
VPARREGHRQDEAPARPQAGEQFIPDTEYYEGDDWPVAPSSIDLVLCTEVLEHVEARSMPR